MAAPAGVRLISPLRVWAVFNALFVVLVLSGSYSIYRLAVHNHRQLVEKQVFTLTKARIRDLENKRFRDFVEGVGRDFGNLYIRVEFADETFEFGDFVESSHCGEEVLQAGGAGEENRVQVKMCRPFHFATSWVVAFVVVYLLISSVSLLLVRRLDKRATDSLVGFLRDSGVVVDAGRGLIGILSEIRGIRENLDAAKSRERGLISAKARAELAEQVLHDIRAPVSASAFALKKADGLSVEELDILRTSLKRIHEVADGLLAKSRRFFAEGDGVPAGEADPEAPHGLAAYPLRTLLDSIIAEVRLRYGDREGIAIEFMPEEGGQVLLGEVVPSVFKRAIANLINNSVEAIDGRGRVQVFLSRIGSEARVKVVDSGHGIPAEVLDRLGERGLTHGKPRGSGLGLYQAKSAVERWGGGLDIMSSSGEGTTVTMRLPCFLRVVLVDNDSLMLKTWKKAASVHGVELEIFSSLERFQLALDGFPKETLIYLDSNFGGERRGENFAQELSDRGFVHVVLATGLSKETFSARANIMRVIEKEPPWS